MKELKDYIHLYVGCAVLAKHPGHEEAAYWISGTLTGLHGEYGPEIQFTDGYHAEESPEYPGIENMKLILRPISSITEAELREYWNWMPSKEVTKWTVEQFGITVAYKYPDFITEGEKMHSERFFAFKDHRYPDQFMFLLKNGFDIFDLKEAGLAIYE